MYQITKLEICHPFAFQENKLYWCDSRNGKIERINLEGDEQREIVFAANGADLFSIAVFGAYLFWSDR